MANPEQLAILKKGVKEWNEWRNSNPKLLPDLGPLKDSSLINSYEEMVDLYKANLVGVNLSATNLREANLREADLRASQLKEANLNRAFLYGANLSRANLEYADLSQADLSETNFSGANLRGVDFSKASLYDTNFANLDLSEVRNLDSALHVGPSHISTSTIYKSKGKIPHKFLREAGIPENLITYMSSLTGKAFEYFSAFISYTEADNAISKRLYADLQSAGLRVWRWREDAKWGAPIEKNIDQAVRIYDKLIVICSEDSLKAPAVIDEIDRALQKEHALMKDGKVPEVLFPITIDDYIFDAWDHYLKPRVMAKTVGDFRGWIDSKKYDEALERLIAALRQEEERE